MMRYAAVLVMVLVLGVASPAWADDQGASDANAADQEAEAIGVEVLPGLVVPAWRAASVREFLDWHHAQVVEFLEWHYRCVRRLAPCPTSA